MGRATKEDLAPYTIAMVGLTMCMPTLVITLGNAMVARDYTLPSIHKCKQIKNPNVTHRLGQVQAQKFMPKSYTTNL
jgi:hypothetical protein